MQELCLRGACAGVLELDCAPEELEQPGAFPRGQGPGREEAVEVLAQQAGRGMTERAEYPDALLI